ncbi:MAG: hypothetical protein ABL865_04075, partial [Candidatus Nitrotoga sp.]
MLIHTGSVRVFAQLLFLSSLLAGCADLPRKVSAAQDKSPEGRVQNATQALQEHPEETSLKAKLILQRERAVLELLTAADKALDVGKWEEAVLLYQRVLGLDDKNQRALSKLKMIDAERRFSRLVTDAREMFDQGNIEAAQNKLHLVLLEAPGNVQALELQARIGSRIGSGIKAPELKSAPNRPIT